MWELDCKESWAQKNWCFWTVVLEKTLESPLDCKEIQPVHPKGEESWVFTGRTDVEAETPVLWPPDAKSWLIGKDPDAGKDWRQVEKRTTEDEIVGWHHWLNGHGFGWTPRVGDGHLGGLACCGPSGHRGQTPLTDWTDLNPLQYSGLENSRDCIVHGVTKSRTRLRDFHFNTKTVFLDYDPGRRNLGRSQWYPELRRQSWESRSIRQPLFSTQSSKGESRQTCNYLLRVPLESSAK